jgi:hypothetical protein
MKRFVSIVMLIALTLPLSVNISAADDVIYPVGSISSDGYLLEEDSSIVDLNEPADRVPSAKRNYPLKNDGPSQTLRPAAGP